MAEFLIGILFHEPEPYRLWQAGIVEDLESSAGLFVEAKDADSALAWGEQVGQALLVHANSDPTVHWKEAGYYCWLVEDPASSVWHDRLEAFPHVSAGQMPALVQMTSTARARPTDPGDASRTGGQRRYSLKHMLSTVRRKLRGG